jgi:threonyl-tRNA synthetase
VLDLPLPTKAAEFIRENAPLYAKAKSERVYLEQFRKSKKALLMAESTERTAAAKEIYAYAHSDYVALLDGLKVAVEAEETIKWKLTAAEAHIEIWRTQSANNRAVDRTHQ